jgi:hypothetical protein
MKKFQIIEEGRNLKQTELNHLKGGADESGQVCNDPTNMNNHHILCATGGTHDTCPSYTPPPCNLMHAVPSICDTIDPAVYDSARVE